MEPTTNATATNATPTNATTAAPTICPEVAEATATPDGAFWTVPGYRGFLSARPISPIALRAELATLQTLADDLRERWLATVEVCGDDIDPNMFDMVLTLADSIERMRATPRARGLEYQAAIAGLATERPAVWAALTNLVRAVNDDTGRPRYPLEAATIALAYALESVSLPDHGATDGAHLFFRALADGEIGGVQ